MTHLTEVPATRLDIGEILRSLPHRYPFLLVDRVIDLQPNQSLTAIKNVSFNEPYFLGHFPQHPIMPGVLIIEALAQATGILAFQSQTQPPSDKTAMQYLVGVDEARFKQPVVPGDQLVLHVKLLRLRQGVGSFDAEARVEDRVVASAKLMCARREI